MTDYRHDSPRASLVRGAMPPQHPPGRLTPDDGRPRTAGARTAGLVQAKAVVAGIHAGSRCFIPPPPPNGGGPRRPRRWRHPAATRRATSLRGRGPRRQRPAGQAAAPLGPAVRAPLEGGGLPPPPARPPGGPLRSGPPGLRSAAGRAPSALPGLGRTAKPRRWAGRAARSLPPRGPGLAGRGCAAALRPRRPGPLPRRHLNSCPSIRLVLGGGLP